MAPPEKTHYMWQAIQSFFNSDEFMPHGHCFLWQTDILWLHLLSDFLIFASYYSIPFALVYFARKRPDMPFRMLFGLFSLFILLCGTTHLFSIWVLWHADYAIEGLIKASTALASLFTAILVWKLMPQLLNVPSPMQLQKLNEQLMVSQEEVAQRVNERTLELAEANRKLAEAYKMAEKASNAKSDFLANMSHEIRTPMNAVIGLSNILSLTSPLTPKQQEYIKTLQLSAESLLSLITDLLDISKIESESITLDNASFNLEQLVAEVVSIVSVKAAERDVSVSLDYTPTLKGDFIGDPTRVRQVLLNLASNAVKFTERGSVTMRVRDMSDNGPLRKALIEVEDTGIGIAPDKLDTIFNKFSQADNTISRKYGGSGLGLTITKALVELMGGQIRVDSKLHQGSRFSVELPLAPGEATGGKRVPAPVPGETVAPGDAPTILIVEDYQPNILVATTILDTLGYRYDVAMNGHEALDKLFKKPFGLVLMDVQMPLLDGYNTTRQIRQREEKEGRSPVPIIGITAFALASDREKCLNAGMDDYISKPFTMAELQIKIQSLLKKQVS